MTAGAGNAWEFDPLGDDQGNHDGHSEPMIPVDGDVDLTRWHAGA